MRTKDDSCKANLRVFINKKVGDILFFFFFKYSLEKLVRIWILEVVASPGTHFSCGHQLQVLVVSSDLGEP